MKEMKDLKSEIYHRVEVFFSNSNWDEIKHFHDKYKDFIAGDFLRRAVAARGGWQNANLALNTDLKDEFLLQLKSTIYLFATEFSDFSFEEQYFPPRPETLKKLLVWFKNKSELDKLRQQQQQEQLIYETSHTT